MRNQNSSTFGKHWKPPPVTLSNASEHSLWGAIAASLQAIMAPDCTEITGSMPKAHTFEKQGPKIERRTKTWLTHGVAKNVSFLPPQMIHQGQGIHGHDCRPARYERPRFKSNTHQTHRPFWLFLHMSAWTWWKIWFPPLSSPSLIPRESYCARTRVKCGIFLVESYMQAAAAVVHQIPDRSGSQGEEAILWYLPNGTAHRSFRPLQPTTGREGRFGSVGGGDTHE
jgi:hypothetical protein